MGAGGAGIDAELGNARLLLSVGTGKLGMLFCSWRKLEFMAAKPVLVLEELLPCKKPGIPRDGCWKWDCVQRGGVDAEEGDTESCIASS